MKAVEVGCHPLSPIRDLPFSRTFSGPPMPRVFKRNCSLTPRMHGRFCALKNTECSPRNVITHELGHAIRLGHNDDCTTLMYGRPAPCRPDAFQSEVAKFFPLTEDDKATLRTRYPRTWKPLPQVTGDGLRIPAPHAAPHIPVPRPQ
jgi:hypothetical protein